MPIDQREIIETIRMTTAEHLDIRTVTIGLSLRDCRGATPAETGERMAAKIARVAANLVDAAREISGNYGTPIANTRLAVTPIAIVADGFDQNGMVTIGRALDQAAVSVGVDFLGGFSALVQKGSTRGDEALMAAIPELLSTTERVCASVNVASTKAGINMDAVAQMGQIIKATARLTGDRGGIGCAKLVTFCNVPEDNPFMAGAFHGVSEPECAINVGISGPGVILEAVRTVGACDLGTLSETIKRTAFKVTRMGEMVGRLMSQRLGIPFGIVDISLAPTPVEGDSVAQVIEAMGVSRFGAPGTTAALAMLNDAIKKGGLMASSYVGGMSGAFIPVAEDAGMFAAAEAGALTLEKLEALTSVCSVGLDMIAIPGDTSAETIAAIIADEMAIGATNNKTTAVRIIPVPGKGVGDRVDFGGLLGSAPIMPVSRFTADAFIARGGRIPAPTGALTN
ncbi:MAG: PFL family protein [candidate division Zixibacteria bacterium]|nr:PFL family protein [candidate division Zixibacteria bacterium]